MNTKCIVERIQTKPLYNHSAADLRGAVVDSKSFLYVKLAVWDSPVRPDAAGSSLSPLISNANDLVRMKYTPAHFLGKGFEHVL